MREEWRPVVGYEGLYEVSSLGAVRSTHREGVYRGRWGDMTMIFPARTMKQSRSPSGYCYLGLKKPNEPSIKHLTHRVVMAAFVGPSNGLQVNHKDGNKENNAIENLEYCTCQENLLHLTRVLKKKIGEASGGKLKERQVRAILADPRTLKQIAADHSVSIQTIAAIKSGRTWGHLQLQAVPSAGQRGGCGYTVAPRKLTEATKAKLSAARRGAANPQFGKPLSEATKAKLSQALRDYHAAKA